MNPHSKLIVAIMKLCNYERDIFLIVMNKELFYIYIIMVKYICVRARACVCVCIHIHILS